MTPLKVSLHSKSMQNSHLVNLYHLQIIPITGAIVKMHTQGRDRDSRTSDVSQVKDFFVHKVDFFATF